MKRFRYKGDLAKHIKRYHPGHLQDLVPIPLQKDEVSALPAKVAKFSKPQAISNIGQKGTHTSPSSDSNKYFFPLLPQHPVTQSELLSSGISVAATSTHQQYHEDDTDLDENILDMFTEDDSTPSCLAAATAEPSNLSTPILLDVLTRGGTFGRSKDGPSATVTSFLVPATTIMKSYNTTNPMQQVTATGIKFNLPSRPMSPQLSLGTTTMTLETQYKDFNTLGITMDKSATLNLVDLKLPTEPSISVAPNSRPCKPFPCDHLGCHRSFEKATLLRRHQKLHSDNCKFVCDVCKKSFESQSKIDDHYRKHTGEKPFLCHLCGNSFRYKGDRTKHLKNLHGLSKVSSLLPPPGSTNSTTNEDSSTTSSLVLNFHEETSSSISSYHSISDAGSNSRGNSVVELSPVKQESQLTKHQHQTSPLVQTGSSQETVTMSLDEVIQFAQPVVTDYY
jgi:hypothetical protein